MKIICSVNDVNLCKYRFDKKNQDNLNKVTPGHKCIKYHHNKFINLNLKKEKLKKHLIF